MSPKLCIIVKNELEKWDREGRWDAQESISGELSFARAEELAQACVARALEVAIANCYITLNEGRTREVLITALERLKEPT